MYPFTLQLIFNTILCLVIFLENARATKEALLEQQNVNSILEKNIAVMKDQVICMQKDWKREQDLVI